VVVGDLVTDVVASTMDAIAVGSDTTAQIIVGDGGAGGNVAAWLRAVGVDVGLVTRVGDDPAGRTAVARLADAGVATAAATDPVASTGTVVALVDATGERTMLTDRGANRALDVADLPATWFRSGAHLHLSGYVLFDDRSRDAGLAALAAAGAAGMTISVDPASWAPLRRWGAARFLAATAGAALTLPNSDEARVLTGVAEPARAALQLARHHGAAVVTCGGDGAVWSDGTATAHGGAVRATVVDSTGAGDAFTAGFLAAWLDGAAPADALDTGAHVAARAAGRRGARPG
jgi:sugar/nucleoside kinase (ribokinase family)